MVKHLANTVTALRIFFGILMPVFPVFSPSFYFCYCLCGITDMIDGTIARKTKSESRFGENLDTVADAVFLLAALTKILPAISIPKWALICLVPVAIIKSVNILLGTIYKKTSFLPHTVTNKLTGIILFLFPFVLNFTTHEHIFAAVCTVTLLSAIMESYYIIKSKYRKG